MEQRIPGIIFKDNEMTMDSTNMRGRQRLRVVWGARGMRSTPLVDRL